MGSVLEAHVALFIEDADDLIAVEVHSAQSAEIECAVHEVALSSLDIDAAFVNVWGKTYRRVHRTERSY